MPTPLFSKMRAPGFLRRVRSTNHLVNSAPVVCFVAEHSPDSKQIMKKLKASGYKLVRTNYTSLDDNKVNLILVDEANQDTGEEFYHERNNKYDIIVSISDISWKGYYEPVRDEKGTRLLTVSRHADDERAYEEIQNEIRAEVEVQETCKKIKEELASSFGPKEAESVVANIKSLIQLAIQPQQALEAIQAALKAIETTPELTTGSKEILVSRREMRAALEKRQTSLKLATLPTDGVPMHRKLQEVIELANRLIETKGNAWNDSEGISTPN